MKKLVSLFIALAFLAGNTSIGMADIAKASTPASHHLAKAKTHGKKRVKTAKRTSKKSNKKLSAKKSKKAHTVTS